MVQESDSLLPDLEETDGVQPGPKRTFAQVVSQGSGCGAVTLKSCCENTECKLTASLGLNSDDDNDNDSSDDNDGSSGDSCSQEGVDKSDARYLNHLAYAINCGYSESDLDNVMAKHGLGCNRNLLLQELVSSSPGSDLLQDDGSDGVTDGGGGEEEEDQKSMSQRSGTAEAFLEMDSEQHADVGEAVKTDQRTEDTDDDNLRHISSDVDSEVDNLRHIIIDGSNVAMSHGMGVFSCRGIQLAVDWFRRRGHQQITVFVPQSRKETPRPDTAIAGWHLLRKLEEQGVLIYTPARRVKGRRVVCYDDRFVLRLAAQTDGVVVSNDNYRDLVRENPQEFKAVVEERLLMYVFVNDWFMPPEDPLGRRGPTLDDFLRKQPASHGWTLQTPCPYGRKCTFGPRCKYSHPERGPSCHKMVSEVLKEKASRTLQEKRAAKSTLPGRSKSKLTRAHRPHTKGDPSSSSLSSKSQQEADAYTTDDSHRKPLPESAVGKTSEYLSEPRKKLVRDLAMASRADPSLTSGKAATYRAREGDSAGQHTAGLEGDPVLPLHTYPYPPPPLPSGSTQEAPVVSGHHLLVNRLSDEAASDFSVCCQEGLAKPQEKIISSPGSEKTQTAFSTSCKEDKNQSRQFSVPDCLRHPDYHHHHHYHQKLLQHVPSAAQHTNIGVGMCVSEGAGSSVVGSFAVHRTPSCAPEPRQQVGCSAWQGNSMDRRCHQDEGYVISNAGIRPRCPGVPVLGPGYRPCHPFIMQSSPDSIPPPSLPPHRCLPYRCQLNTGQQQCRDLRWQPQNVDAFRFQAPRHPSPPSAPSCPPPPPPRPSSALQNVAGFGQGPSSPWPAVSPSPPPPGSPAPPLGSPSPPRDIPASHPSCEGGRAASPPSALPASDPRYPLYRQLCAMFPQYHPYTLLEVISKYSEVSDLQQLCVCVAIEL